MAIDSLFQRLAMRGPKHRHPMRRWLGRRKFGSHVEQLVLDASQQRVDLWRQRFRPGQANGRIQFIDRAIRFDARIVFGDPRSAEEAGVARVTRFGVNLHGNQYIMGRRWGQWVM